MPNAPREKHLDARRRGSRIPVTNPAKLHGFPN
jgi:hypothetical protein